MQEQDFSSRTAFPGTRGNPFDVILHRLEEIQSIPAPLFSLLLFFTATTIFEIPHGALGMEMTSDPHERTRLFSGKSFVGNLFAMSTPWLFALANMEVFRGPGGNEADGMRYVSLMVAAILIPLSFWWTAKLREPGFVRVAKQEKTPYQSSSGSSPGS